MYLRRTLLIAGAASVLAAVATKRMGRFEVAGTSMLPSVEPGDRLLVLRTVAIRPGDVVVVSDPRAADRLVVKRVVEASQGTVTVRGDNPDASTDSRTFGAVPRSSVRGRVVYRYFPSTRRGRVGRLVP